MYIFFIAIAIYVIYQIIRRKTLEKQVDLFNKLLYIERSPEKYIDEVDKLIMKFQSENEKNINYIQKTTGLLYAGRFNEVVSILNEKVKKIPFNWQVAYYHNMLLSLYFSGNIEKANEVLKEAKSIIDSYKKDYNEISIKLIYAIANFYNNRIEECKDFFNTLQNEKTNDYRIAIAYYFSGKILEIEGMVEESNKYLEKAKDYGKGSFIENW